MKTPKNKVTVLKQSPNSRSVTLTNFISFTLLEEKKRLAHIKQSQKPITFATYWSPMRHSINRVHKTAPFNWEALVTTTLLQKETKLVDYMKVAENYTNMFNSIPIKGEKIKNLKTSIEIKGLTVRLNPELNLLDGDLCHIVKFHYSKSIPMTPIVAQQAIALMEFGFGKLSNANFYIFDVYHGKIFEVSGHRKASLERAALNSQAYISLVENHIDIQKKSA